MAIIMILFFFPLLVAGFFVFGGAPVSPAVFVGLFCVAGIGALALKAGVELKDQLEDEDLTEHA